MFYLGRFLQIVGLGITGLGCLEGFNQGTSEATMWSFCLIGLVVFLVGHGIMPKR